MIIDKKTSLLVDKQLPQFIKDNSDYSNFVLFLKAYYEWLESANASNNQISTANTTGQGVTFATKNLLSYKNVDNTIDGFIDYFKNDFLPYFPKDALISQEQAIKAAKQLYQSKGTPSSYQFLFRVLFNSDFNVFYTKDAVLKPSDGIWYVAKSLKLATSDPNFRAEAIKQYRIFGETSLSIATIENSVLAGNKTELFVSNIERLFQSGEYVKVIDQNNQDVYFLNGQVVASTTPNAEVLRAKVVGQISSITIDPNNRGLTYNIGDPVIVYGGLNTTEGHGATAEVSDTTKGSVKSIKVTAGGYGYTADPQTLITIISSGRGSQAVVTSLDPDAKKTANATLIPSDSLGLAWNTHINANTYAFLPNHPTANQTWTMANALTMTTFTTYPIGSVIVTQPGSGITGVPTAVAQSLYLTDYATYPTADLSNLGILAPIQIINGGNGYQANDKITISGGAGYGAFANVISVAANGMIQTVSYVYSQSNNQTYPLGGMGYKKTDKNITATVTSANNQASGAQLFVPGILGDGAQFIVDTDRAGSITAIKINDPGEDYSATPNVSLKVQDIVVSNVSIANLPKIGDTVYQGANINVAVYQATVNSVSLLQPFNDPTQSLYSLRVFNYNSNPNPAQNLRIEKVVGQINMTMANSNFGGTYGNFNQYGYINYGDGSAKATAKFLNGLVVSQGQYLNQQGQPSSFSVLQNDQYNNYTYELTVSKEIEKYRSVLKNLLHPSGMHIVGRMVDRVEVYNNTSLQEALYVGRPFYATVGGIGETGATATMVANFDNASNNIIQFNNIPLSVNLANVIFAGSSFIKLSTPKGNVYSRAVSVDYTHNKVTLMANTWLTFANVANITGIANTKQINITGLTGTYDIINNGKYSNTSYPLKDIVSSGDRIQVANNSVLTVDYVDYTTNNGIIYTTSNLSSNVTSTLAVSRTLTANSDLVYDQIHLYGPIGTTYIPELATEDGRILTTEDGKIILLG